LVKFGPGVLTLSGANTYVGDTTVGEGTLAVLGASTVNAGATALVTVAAGATLDLTGKNDGTLTVGSGQTLAGGGSVLGAVFLDGTESPGASPGTLSSSSQEWNGGAHYNWQVNNATSSAGADPGWDLIHVSSGINFFASITNKFTIDVSSLTPGNTNGLAAGFDNTSNYVWTIATTTNGITNFSADATIINRSAFSNDLGGGTFTLALGNGGNDLQLRFGSNNAPTLTAPANVTMSVNTTNTVTATATDPDVPTTLTFSLVAPPSWASIDPVTGVITLAPDSGATGDWAIEVHVTDDAATPLSDDKLFFVHLTGDVVSPPYNITAITVSSNTVNITWASVLGTKYQVKGSRDVLAPLATWTNVGGVVNAFGTTSSQTDVPGPTRSFYRVQVVP
jgi:autotransporter-associated beta strand protein